MLSILVFDRKRTNTRDKGVVRKIVSYISSSCFRPPSLGIDELRRIFSFCRRNCDCETNDTTTRTIPLLFGFRPGGQKLFYLPSLSCFIAFFKSRERNGDIRAISARGGHGRWRIMENGLAPLARAASGKRKHSVLPRAGISLTTSEERYRHLSIIGLLILLLQLYGCALSPVQSRPDLGTRFSCPGPKQRDAHRTDLQSLPLDPANFLAGWQRRISDVRATEPETLPVGASEASLTIDSRRKLVVAPVPGKRLPVIAITAEEASSEQTNILFDPASINAGGLGSLRLSPSKQYLAISFTTTISASSGYTLLIFQIDSHEAPIVVSNRVHSFEWSPDSRYLYFSAESHQRPNQIARYDTKDDTTTQVHRSDEASVELLLRPSSEEGAAFVINSNPAGDSLLRLRGDEPIATIIPFTKGQSIQVHSSKSGSLFIVDEPVGGSRAIDGQRTLYRPSGGYSITAVDTHENYIFFVERKGARERLVWVNRSDGSVKRSGKEFAPGSFSLIPEQRDGDSRYVFEFESLCRVRRRYIVNLQLGSISKDYEYPVDSLVRHEFSKCVESIVSVLASDGLNIDVAVAVPSAASNTPLEGLVLRSYGAYGASPRLVARAENSLLLGSGIGLAISFIRGGNDYGSIVRSQSTGPGKILAIDDLIRSSRTLQNNLIVASGKVVLDAESAGGAIATSAFLEHPELFAGLMVAAPVLDLEGLLREKTLPGRAREIAEWGDPEVVPALETIRRISPIQRIGNHAYPPVMITFGTEDSIVPLWSIENWYSAFRCRAAETSIVILNPAQNHGHSRQLTTGERFEYEAKRHQFIFRALSGAG